MASRNAELGQAVAALPVLPRHGAQQPVAWHDGSLISAGRFLGDVAQLAQCLPPRAFVFNLCSNRYHFMVTFCAALLRGQTNLLPPNQAALTLAQLHADYPDAYGMTDQPLAVPGLEMLRYPAALPQGAAVGGAPQVAACQVAAITFTSGSTGRPAPHPKTWGELVAGAELKIGTLGMNAGSYFVGTVPPQHMYGLETTVMLPLCSGGVAHAAQPLLPADIGDALRQLAVPRVLVTTPLHLRVCLEQHTAMPPLALILSAAAPLPAELAQRAEQAFAAPVMEIYGCTEAGGIATRRTVQDEFWQPMPGVRVFNDSDGQAWVAGSHLEEPAALQDVIETQADGACFRLLGRSADLIKVAGKRASLADLNHQLNQIEGVRDGVFFLPDEQPGITPRLAALVVAPELSEAEILAALRSRIDPAFLPRPLHKVEALPRSATGKLPRQTLIALLASLPGRNA